MGKKFKVFLDSGANIHSSFEQYVDLEKECGITDEAWENMSEKEQDDFMREIAFSNSDWGYWEVE